MNNDTEKINSLKDSLLKANAHIDMLENRNYQISAERDRLFSELANYSGLKAQLKSLLHTVHDRLLKYIFIFGKVPEQKEVPLSLPQKPLKDNYINVKIIQYDKKVFSDKRLFGGNFRKLSYILLVTSLDIIVFIFSILKSFIVKVLGR